MSEQEKERPIIFSGAMVRAILDGQKTQTRRVMKLQPVNIPRVVTVRDKLSAMWREGFGNRVLPCPYGKPGDLLWVRETWADVNTCEGPAICYRADGSAQTWHDFSESFGPDYGAGYSMDYESYPGEYSMWIDDLLAGEPDHKWKPSIHMPKWACRLHLKITNVRVERLRDISEEDARAEGAPRCGWDGEVFFRDDKAGSYKVGFAGLWDSINGKKYPWESNPWVWVIEFQPTDRAKRE